MSKTNVNVTPDKSVKPAVIIVTDMIMYHCSTHSHNILTIIYPQL